MLKVPSPTTAKQMREILGTAEFCHLWSPGFAEIAKPLYEATKDKLNFVWTKDRQRAFDILKQRLLETSALGLPDVSKPFYLFMDEHTELAKDVLTQTVGPWKRLVANLSKNLDPVVTGWSLCLCIVATMALIVVLAN